MSMHYFSEQEKVSNIIRNSASVSAIEKRIWALKKELENAKTEELSNAVLNGTISLVGKRVSDESGKSFDIAMHSMGDCQPYTIQQFYFDGSNYFLQVNDVHMVVSKLRYHENGWLEVNNFSLWTEDC